MTRCTLLDTWFDSESIKIDKFESTSNRQFIEPSKKRGKIWTYLLSFGRN